MSFEPINLRRSCLIARADACAAGFDRLGKTFSADFTRSHILYPLEANAPTALYEHFVAEQEQRLAKMEVGR